MPKAVSVAPAEGVSKSLRFLENMFRGYHPRDFSVRFWDGTSWNPEKGRTANFTLVLEHPGSLRKMFWPLTEAALGEAYVYGDVDIEGDIESACNLSDFFRTRAWGVQDLVRYSVFLLTTSPDGRQHTGRQAAHLSGSPHSMSRDRQAVTYHYDVSNDFFSLWLDSRMVYSTAYFQSPEEDLETAQERKLDYICRKLRLQPGDRFLDIGCGWGGLVVHAAKQYGVEATGITLSRPQARLAAERIDGNGLGGRCRVEVMDYRELGGAECFDKIASVGMFEHVGEAKLPEYFRRAWTLLRPGGLFLNHGIGYTRAEKAKRGSFVDRYVFPDGELLPVSATLRAAEACGFEVRDVESLREHYALTLRNWVRRLEGRHGEAVLATDEATYRTWRLYMAGSAHGFKTGRLNIFQTLLVKPDEGRSGLPLTRADWYKTADGER